MADNLLLALAQYLIMLAENAKRPLTNKKLQKLLYYAQAWSLVLRNKPLFDEPIEAWIHGPVVPSVYRRYKEFGFGFIKEKNISSNLPCDEIKELLDEVWQIYGKYDADYLEALSHSESPWIQARSTLDAETNSSAIISHESMIAFYSRLQNEKTK